MEKDNIDYMQVGLEDERAYRQQIDPSEWSATSIATVTLLLLALGCTAYFTRGLWYGSATRPGLTPAHVSRSASTVPPPSATDTPGRPPMVRDSSNSVIKCTSDGATTYAASAADCPRNAKTSVVSIHSRQNLSDGLPNAAQIIRKPSAYAQDEVTVSTSGVDANIQLKAACEAYEMEIKAIDARARQPLSAQEQDWLTAKRHKARDEQFRLRC